MIKAKNFINENFPLMERDFLMKSGEIFAYINYLIDGTEEEKSCLKGRLVC